MNIKAFYHNSKFILIVLLALGFSSCVRESVSTDEAELEDMYKVSDKDLIEPVALDIIGVSASTLMQEVSSAIEKDGIKDAIDYCNVNANKIVQELSEEYGVEIKRTSLKLRNAKNYPTNDEKLVLDFFANQHVSGKDCNGQLSKVDGVYKYYYPIYVMDKCTQCHGIKGEGLNKKAAKKLEELYPNDQALGYQAGDLRGMWVLSFTK